jgi:hypothetical protein
VSERSVFAGPQRDASTCEFGSPDPVGGVYVKLCQVARSRSDAETADHPDADGSV